MARNQEVWLVQNIGGDGESESVDNFDVDDGLITIIVSDSGSQVMQLRVAGLFVACASN